jgi:polysaccharide biosynthesis protein PslH
VKRHHITYIGRGTGGESDARASQFFAGQGLHPILVDDPLPARNNVGFYARLAANIVQSYPYSIQSHITPRMAEAVARHAATTPIDVLQLENEAYLYTARGLDVPIVIQAHNIEANLWKRHYEIEKSPVKRAYIKEQWRKFLRFEGDAYHRADRVVCCSEADAALAARSYGAVKTSVVDNGVDVGRFAAVAPDRNSNKILFLGALDWRPNLDAVALLLGEIFPLLRAQVPGAELLIVGRHPPDQLRKKIAGIAGVSLHADVPDVTPYLAQCALMTVPLRIGGGSRLKILEALAAGLPVVSTTIGAEGLELEDGRHLRLADSPSDHALALAAALKDPAGSFARAAAGRTRVAERYGWPMLADRLEAVWQSVARDYGHRAHGGQQRLAAAG